MLLVVVVFTALAAEAVNDDAECNGGEDGEDQSNDESATSGDNIFGVTAEIDGVFVSGIHSVAFAIDVASFASGVIFFGHGDALAGIFF